MRWLVLVALILGAHYVLTALAPGEKSLLIWPFAKESRPTLDLLGSATAQAAQLLAVLGGACLLAAAAALLGWLIPAPWFVPLVLVGAGSSVVLFLLYFGVMTLIPLAIDGLLLWGVLGGHWTVALLRN